MECTVPESFLKIMCEMFMGSRCGLHLLTGRLAGGYFEGRRQRSPGQNLSSALEN